MSYVTSTEYISRVISFYSRNTVKCGKLSFDEKSGRFVILDKKGKNVFDPDDGIHCGDIYLMSGLKGVWKFGQCELTADGIWVMCGTNITSKNYDKICPDILYVKNKRLSRITDEHIPINTNWGTVSDDFVRDVLRCKEI